MLCGLRSCLRVIPVTAVLIAFCSPADAVDLPTPAEIARRVDAAPSGHPLTPVLKTANKALQKIASVSDYEADFIKKEYVGSQFLEQKMRIRFRRQPMSVYLRFVEPHEGRQVIYVQGQNGGQLQVKEAGLASLVGTISLDPNGAMALAESKYPITMIGMENMTRRIMSEWLDATSRDDITVKFYPNAKIGGTPCEVIETTHTDAIASKGVYRARLYIDKASGLPIRIQEFGFPKSSGGEPPLLSDYVYLNVRTDVGMTALDFDPASPRSGF